jgi:uncharacterized membrane protein
VNGDHVPGLAVLIAYVLVVISIMMLVLYVHHIGQSLRVSALIELVGNDTRERIDEEYEPGAPCRNEHGAVVMPSSAVVSAIDEDRLVEVARRHDARVEMHWGIGSFVPAGATLAVVDGGTPPRDHEVLRCIGRTLERDLDHDAAYGIRMLVDMAERSVSESSFLDPTTAVQAIDRIHDCLRQLVTRQFRSEHVRDEDGVVRVIVPRMSWNDYVRLAFEEIRLAGAGSPQVSRRVEAALTDLCAVAPPERRAVLDEQLDLLHSAVEDRHRDVRDTQMAAGGDTEGIGRATSTPSRA